jgi:hypothetical protein
MLIYRDCVCCHCGSLFGELLKQEAWADESMSRLSLRLPDSIQRHLKHAADVDCISVNPFINLAVAGKLSALQTYDIIAERAKGGSRESFLEAMARVPKGPIVTGD